MRMNAVVLACAEIAVITAAHAAMAAPSETRVALLRVHHADGSPVGSLLEGDVGVQEGTTPCDVTRVSPAAYPVAIVIDTSGFARADFQLLRQAAQHLAASLDGRDVAIYASGNPVTRLSTFSRDVASADRALARAFSNPQGSTHTFEAIARAAGDLARLSADLTRIVVFSAGGSDASGVSPRDVLKAVDRSRSIVDIVDQREQMSGTMVGERSRTVATPLAVDDVVLRKLAERTHGEYLRILSGTAFGTSAQTIERDLSSEFIVEYAAPDNAARDLRLSVAVPDVTLTGIALRR